MKKRMEKNSKIGHSESFWTTLVGKDWENWAFQILLDHIGGKRLEKVK